MELLIPGLILVALMVYASTRIKKIAASAFEPETIETDDFVIKKSEGFLNVIGGDPQYAFEAYSKDFGTEAAEKFRQATVKLRTYDGKTTDEAIADLQNGGTEIVSDIGEVIGDQKYRVIEARRIEKDVEFRIFYKITENNGRLYELEIMTLSETTEAFMSNIEAMLNSVEIK